MKLEWAFVVIFAVMAGAFLWEISRSNAYNRETMIIVSKALKERDEKILDIHTRVQTLEKERDLYRRVRNIEKSLRAFCVDGQTAMCASLSPIRKEDK